MSSKSGSGARALLATRAGCRYFQRWQLALLGLVFPAGRAAAQTSSADSVPNAIRASVRSASSPAALDSLLRLAESASPAVRAAHARAAAARARVRPAGARPDPMIMAGFVNLPISQPSFTADEMTMRMVGVGQTIPYPGKLRLQRRAADSEAAGANAALVSVQVEVARSVREAYFELAYAIRTLALFDSNRQLLSDVARIAEARYGSRTGEQLDVWRARVEATRMAESTSLLLEQQRVSLAQLNASLNQASDVPIAPAVIPDRIARAAVAIDPKDVRFVAASLGARAAASLLPSLASLQSTAAARSPTLQQHAAMIAAQSARVELARKEYKPDFEVSLQYGQRQGRPDMISAQVSVPLRMQKSARQDPQLAEARADLAALEADHVTQRNTLGVEIARQVGVAEQSRTQLALYTIAILPQGRAGVDAALASYRAGRGDLTTVLTAQSALFASEITYARAMTDFAKAIAALEQIVGTDVLRQGES